MNQQQTQIKKFNPMVLVKFVAPPALKRDLENLAQDRNITLSSLLRLITTEYTKRNTDL